MAEIYALTDPRTGAVHYIGLANGQGGMQDRYGWHLRDVSYAHNTSPKAAWMRELREHDLLPGLVRLERCDGPGYDRERAWIDLGLAEGWPLTNRHGVPGMVSDATRYKLSAALRGRAPSQATRNAVAAANQRRVWDAGARQQMSEALTGRTMAAEHRAKISAAHHARNTWRCDECGLTTKAGPLGGHQNATGHRGRTHI